MIVMLIQLGFRVTPYMGANGKHNKKAQTIKHGKWGVRKPCEKCTEKGIPKPRLAFEGERFCATCRDVIMKKMVESGYLKGDGGGDSISSKPKMLVSEAGNSYLDFIHESVQKYEDLSSLSCDSPVRGSLHFGEPPSLVQAIANFRNPVLKKFKTNPGLENKYRRDKKFKKLNSTFPIHDITDDEDYKNVLRKVLSIEYNGRAANFAYLKLMDERLKKYEEGEDFGNNDVGWCRRDRCKILFAEVANEMEDRANKLAEESDRDRGDKKKGE